MPDGRAYYNEHDPFAASWLRSLIAAGHIASGEVDERDIRDVASNDVRGFSQCHWFGGIGGWSCALRLAGWEDSRQCWTGSCPCQPWSVSGKRRGNADDRDLWPAWRRLIEECRPATILGEQVTGTPAWLGRLRGDLEALDYAVGCVPIEAASAGADHFRDRYWFVADRDGERSQVEIGERGDVGAQRPAASGGGVRAVVDPPGLGWGEGWTEHEFRRRGFAAAVADIDGCQFVECPDGKWRRLPPPRVRWLGTRVPSRVDLLRGFGNAIDTRPAVAFIQAVMEAA